MIKKWTNTWANDDETKTRRVSPAYFCLPVQAFLLLSAIIIKNELIRTKFYCVFFFKHGKIGDSIGDLRYLSHLMASWKIAQSAWKDSDSFCRNGVVLTVCGRLSFSVWFGLCGMQRRLKISTALEVDKRIPLYPKSSFVVIPVGSLLAPKSCGADLKTITAGQIARLKVVMRIVSDRRRQDFCAWSSGSKVLFLYCSQLESFREVSMIGGDVFCTILKETGVEWRLELMHENEFLFLEISYADWSDFLASANVDAYGRGTLHSWMWLDEAMVLRLVVLSDFKTTLMHLCTCDRSEEASMRGLMCRNHDQFSEVGPDVMVRIGGFKDLIFYGKKEWG